MIWDLACCDTETCNGYLTVRMLWEQVLSSTSDELMVESQWWVDGGQLSCAEEPLAGITGAPAAACACQYGSKRGMVKREAMSGL